MTQLTILCVENDKQTQTQLLASLSSVGYNVIISAYGSEAIARANRASLILFDPLLPDMDGMEVLRRLKAAPAKASIPVVVLSEKDDEMDKVLAFELGADDYVVKPYSVRILLARVKALLRTARSTRFSPSPPGIIRNGPLVINTEGYQDFLNGEKIDLTLLEYELLKYLAENAGTVCSKENMFEAVWGSKFYGTTRTLCMYIKRVRDKLGEDAKLIETVRGVGYKMVRA